MLKTILNEFGKFRVWKVLVRKSESSESSESSEFEKFKFRKFGVQKVWSSESLSSERFGTDKMTQSNASHFLM